MDQEYMEMLEASRQASISLNLLMAEELLLAVGGGYSLTYPEAIQAARQAFQSANEALRCHQAEHPPELSSDDVVYHSHDLSDDADALVSAGWGMDEDYGTPEDML